jgi:hypothetical protein
MNCENPGVKQTQPSAQFDSTNKYVILFESRIIGHFEITWQLCWRLPIVCHIWDYTVFDQLALLQSYSDCLLSY